MSQRGRAVLVAWCVGFVACGGDDPAVDAGADAFVDAPVDASFDVGRDVGRDVGFDAGFDVGVDVPVAPAVDSSCDPTAHVDCFFAVECTAGAVRRSANSPYPCCNQATCSAAFAAGVCWVGRATCTDGCGPSRRWRCNSNALRMRYAFGGGDLTELCAEGGRAPGDGCATDAQCAPQRAGLPGRLTCDRDAGVCVTAPRPSVDAGAACTFDDDCADGMVCGCDSEGGPGRCGPDA